MLRRSASAHSRRHPLYSGPDSVGLVPSAARRRAVQKSVSDSSPSTVTACSIRAPKRRVLSSSIGPQRAAEHDLGAAGLRALHALAEDRAGAVDEDRDDRCAGARRQVGGAALEVLAPTVGGASALRVDHEAVAVVDQVADHVGRLAAGDLTVDRDGVERQRGDRWPSSACRRSSRRPRPRPSCAARRRARSGSSTPVSRWL